MLRTFVCAVLALVIFAGGLMAAEGTIVSFAEGKLTVKVGDKEQVIEMRGLKVTGKDGAALTGGARREALKKDAKIETVEKDGKIVEIKIK